MPASSRRTDMYSSLCIAFLGRTVVVAEASALVNVAFMFIPSGRNGASAFAMTFAVCETVFMVASMECTFAFSNVPSGSSSRQDEPGCARFLYPYGTFISNTRLSVPAIVHSAEPSGANAPFCADTSRIIPSHPDVIETDAIPVHASLHIIVPRRIFRQRA